jgi:hypothetical protein
MRLWRNTRTTITATALLLGTALFTSRPDAAQNAPVSPGGEVHVEIALPPAPFLPSGAPVLSPPGGEAATGDATLEPSAAEPLTGDGRLLLVADDKTNGLLVVDVATGRQIGDRLTSRAFPAENAKWEALARDPSDNTFYLIGSHTGRTREELAAHSYLLAFRITGGGTDNKPFAIDESSVARYDIAGALARDGLYNLADPTKNRVKIEGLAVRTARSGGGPAGGALVRRELVVGLREPDDPITVYAADITVRPSAVSGNAAPLPLRKRFTFAARTREKGVRSQLASLDYVPALGGFLLVTSSEDADNKYHGNTLWFLADAGVRTGATAQRVWVFGVGQKAEGLCVLDAGAVAPAEGEYRAARVAVIFDNDAASTNKPARFQIVTLVRWPR